MFIAHTHICGAGYDINPLTEWLGPAWHTLPYTRVNSDQTNVWQVYVTANVAVIATLIIICLVFYAVTFICASVKYTSRGNVIRYLYGSTISLSSALDGGGWSVPRRCRFTPWKDSLYRSPGGPQGRSGQVRIISPPQGFDPRTVQPVTSRYTDYALSAHLTLNVSVCSWFVTSSDRKDKMILYCHSFILGCVEPFF
jgi:hypothetical protein